MADFLGRLRRLWNPDRGAGQPGSTRQPGAVTPESSAPPGPGSGGDGLPDAAGQLAALNAMGLTFEDWATPERMTRDLIRNIDDSPPGAAKPGGRHRRGVYWWPLEIYPGRASSRTRWRITLFAPSRHQRELWTAAGPLEAWDNYLSAQARALPENVRPRDLVVLAHSGTAARGRLDLLLEGEPCAMAVRDFSDLSALDAAQSLLSLAAPVGKAVVAPEPPGMVGGARTCFLVDADRAADFRLLWRRHLEPLKHDAHRYAVNRPPVHAAALETPGLPEGTRPPALGLPVPDVPLGEQLTTLQRLGLRVAPGAGEEQIAIALAQLARSCPDGSPDPGVGPYLGLLRLSGQGQGPVSLERKPDGRQSVEWKTIEERFLVPLRRAEQEFREQVQWFRFHDFERQLAEDERLDVRAHLLVLEGMGFPVGGLSHRREGELRTLVEDSLSPTDRPSVWRGLFDAVDAGRGRPVLGHNYPVPDSPLDYFGAWEEVVSEIAEAAGTTGLVDSVRTSGGAEEGVLQVEYAGKVHEFRPEYLGKHLDRVVLAELCGLLGPPKHVAVEAADRWLWVHEDHIDEFRRRILPALL